MIQPPLPFMQTEMDWRPTPVVKLPTWPTHGRIAIDVETRDEHLKKLGIGVRRGGYIVGVSFAIEDGPAYYLPVRHESREDNLDPEKVFAYLRRQAAGFRGSLCGAHLAYDLDYLAEAGVEFPNVEWFRDALIAEPLINEHQKSYSLDAVAQGHGLPGKDEGLLRQTAQDWGVDPKSGLWQLPGRCVAAYAIGDVLLPLKVLRRQERMIEDQGLWDIYNLESRLLPVLVRMRRRGVRVDFDHLDRVEKWARSETLKALDLVDRETGYRLQPEDVWTAAAMAKPLLKIGVKLEKTEKTEKWSVRDEIFDQIDLPVAKALQRSRKMEKLIGTFVASVRRYEVNGRIHGTLNQLKRTGGDGKKKGTITGRLSAADPNLQQQPGRDPEIGPLWRAIYIPDEGKRWACLDYSKQEPRMLVHFAELTNCRGAKEMAERWRADPSMDIYIVLAELTGVSYGHAKTIYLGLSYGMGPAKLCRELGLPTKWIRKYGKSIEVAGDEGDSLFQQFHHEAPFIRELSMRCQRVSKRRGWIKTVLSRKLHFTRDESGQFEKTHLGLNKLVQGSSADQTKKAMVDGDAAGYELQLQVHDEINFSVDNAAQAEGMADIMMTCVPLQVPSFVVAHVADNWGAAK